MDLYVGTSGYSYKEWKGSFYPEDLPAKEMLRYYAERFRTVEINNTFYRMPKASVLESWAEQVPESFRFVLKGPQRITHIKRLVEVAAEHGFGEYRTAPAYQDLIMSTYSFNNHVLRRFHETLKDAVDPNGILAAGRYGIWPKHLRKA